MRMRITIGRWRRSALLIVRVARPKSPRSSTSSRATCLDRQSGGHLLALSQGRGARPPRSPRRGAEVVQEELEMAREWGFGNRRAGAAHAWHARARKRSRAPGGGGRAAGAVDDRARIRKGTVCIWHDVAPGAQADRRPRTPAQSARSRERLRRDAAGRARPHRASRHRRPSPPRRRQRRCLADAIGKPRRRPRRRWHVEPRDRPGALRDAKTVEVQLSNTYRKLEIRSRRELSGALAPA